MTVLPDTRSFVYASFEDDFYEYWESAVQRVINNEVSDWKIGEKPSPQRPVVSNWKRKLLGSFVGSSNPDVILCRPLYKCSKREWLSQILKWRKWLAWNDFEYTINYSQDVDHSWRYSQVTNYGRGMEYRDIVSILLPLHIPSALLEGFESYRTSAYAQGVARPKLLYTSNSLHHHLMFKILAADWQQEGTRILNHQHGGGYGVEKKHTIESYEVRVSDRFYSWGWGEENCKIKSLSPPFPSYRKREARHKLLVCGNYPETVYRLHYQPLPGTVSQMELNAAEFISNLSNNDDLIVRLSYAHGKTAQKEKLLRVNRNIVFDESRPSIFDRYSESKLVIHNYLGTSWLESLAFNIPTICIYDPDTYVFREEAQSYIDGMMDAGIMHTNGKEAGEFVSGLDGRKEEWWWSSIVQQARCAFTDKFANFRISWAQEWENEFQELLAQ